MFDIVIGLNMNEWNVLYVVCIGLNLTIYFILCLINTSWKTIDLRSGWVRVKKNREIIYLI